MKKKITNKSNTVSDKAAIRMADAIRWTQEKFAKSMTKLSAKVSLAGLKTILILILLLGTAWSAYTIISAFTVTTSIRNTYRPAVIKLPVTMMQTPVQTTITQQEYERVHALSMYLDSVRIRDIRRYNHILKERPGLIDSLYRFEIMYQSQSKNN